MPIERLNYEELAPTPVLTPVGAFVRAQLAQQRPVGNIVAELCRDYGMQLADASVLVDKMQTKEFVRSKAPKRLSISQGDPSGTWYAVGVYILSRSDMSDIGFEKEKNSLTCFYAVDAQNAQDAIERVRPVAEQVYSWADERLSYKVDMGPKTLSTLSAVYSGVNALYMLDGTMASDYLQQQPELARRSLHKSSALGNWWLIPTANQSCIVQAQDKLAAFRLLSESLVTAGLTVQDVVDMLEQNVESGNLFYAAGLLEQTIDLWRDPNNYALLGESAQAMVDGYLNKYDTKGGQRVAGALTLEERYQSYMPYLDKLEQIVNRFNPHSLGISDEPPSVHANFEFRSMPTEFEDFEIFITAVEDTIIQSELGQFDRENYDDGYGNYRLTIYLPEIELDRVSRTAATDTKDGRIGFKSSTLPSLQTVEPKFKDNLDYPGLTGGPEAHYSSTGPFTSYNVAQYLLLMTEAQEHRQNGNASEAQGALDIAESFKKGFEPDELQELEDYRTLHPGVWLTPEDRKQVEDNTFGIGFACIQGPFANIGAALDVAGDNPIPVILARTGERVKSGTRIKRSIDWNNIDDMPNPEATRERYREKERRFMEEYPDEVGKPETFLILMTDAEIERCYQTALSWPETAGMSIEDFIAGMWAAVFNRDTGEFIEH